MLLSRYHESRSPKWLKIVYHLHINEELSLHDELSPYSFHSQWWTLQNLLHLWLESLINTVSLEVIWPSVRDEIIEKSIWLSYV